MRGQHHLIQYVGINLHARRITLNAIIIIKVPIPLLGMMPHLFRNEEMQSQIFVNM